jgi:oligoribonuclease NrnB/cAMP/cGMP phosphodiesterase (DHH superfamily)
VKILCIYHANCADGLAAAWVVKDAHSSDDVTLHEGVYGEPTPGISSFDRVYIVDFSYDETTMHGLAVVAKSLVWIDHHKSAQPLVGSLSRLSNVDVLFSLEHSGCGLAWQYFHGGNQPPRLIEVIEDRDLWQFNIEHTKEITAGLFSYPHDMATYDLLMKNQNDELEHLRRDGVALVRNHNKQVDQFLKFKHVMYIGGFQVPVANVPYVFASDAGHVMALGCMFAATYWCDGEHFNFSLRSDKCGTDVSQIAKLYGGGGHKHAAGFSVKKLEDL